MPLPQKSKKHLGRKSQIHIEKAPRVEKKAVKEIREIWNDVCTLTKVQKVL